MDDDTHNLLQALKELRAAYSAMSGAPGAAGAARMDDAMQAAERAIARAERPKP